MIQRDTWCLWKAWVYEQINFQGGAGGEGPANRHTSSLEPRSSNWAAGTRLVYSQVLLSLEDLPSWASSSCAERGPPCRDVVGVGRPRPNLPCQPKVSNLYLVLVDQQVLCTQTRNGHALPCSAEAGGVPQARGPCMHKPMGQKMATRLQPRLRET